ncbi:CRIB domain-containing protein RIC7-like [Amaranthus tricolor]|uniref:CRIB domain-containing protein RIC7-like n=1 Tax=Amaranthus tricolor TaxID=29722 RepID=UPI00258CDE22|nr:CRIB domain-containing protein RIC7-like [Amaranthus tricolor]
MKGLLKSLRYISQIFEDEEEDKEIQIGFPTDVKHVVHIGWDGPSETSPSWMNEFESPAPGNVSAPVQVNGVANSTSREIEDLDTMSQDSSSTKRSVVKESPGRDVPGLPKSSRRRASWDNNSIGSADSPMGSPNHKTKSSRRRQKQKESSSGSPRGESSNSQGLPNIPKKSRRKKSKDSDGSLKSSLRSKGSKNGSRHGSDDGSLTKQYNKEANSSTSLPSLKEEEVKL